MTETNHNLQCLLNQETLKKFEEAHPTYCRKCGGSGISHTPGSRWEPPSDDPCQCLETGHCPMCLEPVDFNEETQVSTCQKCGWSDKTYIETGEVTWETAPDFDCYCWEEEHEARLEKWYEETAGDAHLESSYEDRFFVEE